MDHIPALDVTLAHFPGNASGKEKELKADKRIALVEPNLIYRSTLTPNDPGFAQQWGFPRISAPTAWDVTQGSSATVIAVVDTGVQRTHPDLDAKIVPGYDFVQNDTAPDDGNGHGTHVAGTAAAETANATGGSGTCPGCRIMPVRVLDNNGSGSLSNVAKGITYARGQRREGRQPVARWAGLEHVAECGRLRGREGPLPRLRRRQQQHLLDAARRRTGRAGRLAGADRQPDPRSDLLHLRQDLGHGLVLDVRSDQRGSGRGRHGTAAATARTDDHRQRWLRERPRAVDPELVRRLRAQGLLPAAHRQLSAWLGGYNSATDAVAQAVTVPSNGTLTYWWYLTTQESGSTVYDRLRVRVLSSSGSVLATLRTWSNASGAGLWRQDSLSLAAYAGQSVRLEFVATTDYSLPSSFFVDDVSLA